MSDGFVSPHSDYLRRAAVAAGIPPVADSGVSRRRKDRHGRGPRGPRFHPALPVWTTRRESFYEEMQLALAQMAAREPGIADIEFGVEEVPPSNPAEWESHDVVLARSFPRDRRRGLRDRIVLYRRPICARATEEELPFALRIILAERICDILALRPEDLLG